MTRLRRLHLEQTEVGDAVMRVMPDLPGLEYLNVYGTKVTDEGIGHLEANRRLQNLYVWQTDVSYDAAQELEAAVPGLEVNLGWNHPRVVRERLTKELEQVSLRKEEASKAAAEAEARLQVAKEQQEAAASREAELEKQLAELDPPAGEGQAAGESDEAKPADEAASDEKSAAENEEDKQA